MRDLLEWAAENPGKSLADAVLRDGAEQPDSDSEAAKGPH